MFEDVEDFDRYCGYTPPSQSEETTVHYQMSPDTSSSLRTLQPGSSYSVDALHSGLEESPSYRFHTMQPRREGCSYSLHTMQPVQYQEGSSYSSDTMQPMQYQELRSPSNLRVSEESPYNLHSMQPVHYQKVPNPSYNREVSDRSPFGHQVKNETFAFKSCLPEEDGHEFTEGHYDVSMGEELSYQPSSYARFPYYGDSENSIWDQISFTNDEHFDNFDEQIFDKIDEDDYRTDDGEIELNNFDYGKVDCNGDDKLDNSMRSTSHESSEGDDSEEVELIVIDSDTDDDSVLPPAADKYCEYPVGKSNTVIVSEKDYRTLEYSKFLNDIIIDFYLNYIFLHILTVEHRSSVHIFSTLFYKRLLQTPKKKRKSENFEEDPNIPLAEKRHRRVSGWTKSVDIFSKSVLLIPICKNSHWFLLLVIGLSGVDSKPFILVLDSLGGDRKREARIIRNYLACEYQAKKMEGNLGFSDVDIPSVLPAKPEQPNGTDCGVYLLHYAEKIFQRIEKFMSPDLPCLKKWFKHGEVEKKRSEIALLIRNLSKEQNPDNDVKIPDIPFSLQKDNQIDAQMEMEVEKVKSVDDFINRLEHLAEENSVEASQKPKKIAGSDSEIKISSSIRKRVVRKKTNNLTSSGDFKSSLSRSFSVQENKIKTEFNYCKSYSKGFKIPKLKKPDDTKTLTEEILSESDPDHSRPENDLSTDKLPPDESKLNTFPGSSKSQIDSPGSSKWPIDLETVTICPVYGDSCESAYHRHPKVKNPSRSRRNGGNGTGFSLGGEASNSSKHDDQYLQTNKSNIVDKILAGARETSNV